MDKVFVVTWASVSQDDDGNSNAFGNVHGVYLTRASALKGLEERKNEIYDEIVNAPDYDEEDRRLAEVNTSVYGSQAEGYYEIDYELADTFAETYITIVEQEVQA